MKIHSSHPKLLCMAILHPNLILYLMEIRPHCNTVIWTFLEMFLSEKISWQEYRNPRFIANPWWGSTIYKYFPYDVLVFFGSEYYAYIVSSLLLFFLWVKSSILCAPFSMRRKERKIYFMKQVMGAGNKIRFSTGLFITLFLPSCSLISSLKNGFYY